MGWLKFYTNILGANGTREIVRITYKTRYNDAIKEAISDDEPSAHYLGLYCALEARYLSAGQLVPPASLWRELSPFLLMEETVAVEALAEYILYKERPMKANKELLRSEISKAIRFSRKTEDSPFALILPAFKAGAIWIEFLEDDVLKMIFSTHP